MSLTAQSRLSANGHDAATRPTERDIRASRSIFRLKCQPTDFAAVQQPNHKTLLGHYEDMSLYLAGNLILLSNIAVWTHKR
jgi:hypothetical protein